jgi:dihydroorotase
MSSELLRQVRVLDPVAHLDHTADVWIEEGEIKAIADSIESVPESVQIYDRPGLVLGPGLVDLYSHSGEPGFESRETLLSLMKAAIAGGFTRLTLLPDTDPVLDQPAVFDLFRNALKRYPSLPVTLSHWGALTIGAEGKQMTELIELAEAGVVGFADGKPLQNTMLIRRLLEYTSPLSQPIAVWCCDRDLTANGVVREGIDSIRLGLPGIPASAETTAIASLLEQVEMTTSPIHLMRISTARGVEMVRTAKTKGLPITASTTWMHLLLNITAVSSYDPNLRLDPPLGNPEDHAALIQGIREGVIDAIAIDHSPYTYEEKTVAFAEAPPGAIGLELALPLLWQKLVVTGELSALTLWRSLSTHPAHCLNQKVATMTVGQPAELTLFDPQTPWTVNKTALNSRSTNTPWWGKEITGKVIKTWLKGS